ncbi:MAG: zf-HC2 domain-containing protein [Capsulimonadales bacterium]|nr:zf-HC2 domain-containing protein [Capsulimonadales bacterium]
MTCSENADRIGPYVDDDLPEETRQRTERHLLTCPHCAFEAETLRITRDRLRAGIGEEMASDALRSRLLTRLRADNPHLNTAEPENASQPYQLPIGF